MNINAAEAVKYAPYVLSAGLFAASLVAKKQLRDEAKKAQKLESMKGYYAPRDSTKVHAEFIQPV